MFKKLTRTAGKLTQKGFTLIELIVVVAIIGALIAIIAPATSGSKQVATANQLYRTANAMVDNWKLIADSCGIATVGYTINPALGDPETILFRKQIASAAAEDIACFNGSGAGRIAGPVQITAGNYELNGFPVRLVLSDTPAPDAVIEVEYDDVPNNVVLEIVRKFSAQTVLAASEVDVTLPYGYGIATAAGTRTLTMRYPAN